MSDPSSGAHEPENPELHDTGIESISLDEAAESGAFAETIPGGPTNTSTTNENDLLPRGEAAEIPDTDTH